MFNSKKSQIGGILGNFFIALVVSIFVFGLFYGITPLIIELRAPIFAQNPGILLRLVMSGFVGSMWTIWVMGTVYLFKRAVNGEGILGA